MSVLLEWYLGRKEESIRYVFLNPNNFHQSYVTTSRTDANIPAGYVLTSGSDGAPDAALQRYVAGVNSLCPDLRVHPLVGVSAFYVSDPTQDQTAKNLQSQGKTKGLWINGILGGGIGD